MAVANAINRKAVKRVEKKNFFKMFVILEGCIALSDCKSTGIMGIKKRINIQFPNVRIPYRIPVLRLLPNKIYMYFYAVIELAIIGTGKVARALLHGLRHSGQVRVVQVVGRDPVALSTVKEEVPVALPEAITASADMYLIAVSDDVIPSVSEWVKSPDKLVVHTSGAVPIDALAARHRKGVCYPLQSFSEGRNPDLREVPFFLEAEHKRDLPLLHALANSLSDTVQELDSATRQHLHLAAVFANNFTNHLYTLSYELMRKSGLSPGLLRPLIHETAQKIGEMDPFDAQTGPARRGDKGSMEQHLRLLEKESFKTIYSLLSNSILETYGKKL